jgi:hypothetical protein
MAMLALALEFEVVLAQVIRSSSVDHEEWPALGGMMNGSAKDRNQDCISKSLKSDRLGRGDLELALGCREKSEVVGGLLGDHDLHASMSEAVKFRNQLAHDLPFTAADTARSEVEWLDRLMVYLVDLVAA